MDLRKYLDGEQLVAEHSRRQYRVELELAEYLGSLFDRLRSEIRADTETEIPAHLLLLVINQYYGTISQLLRCRLADAQVITRRAIEATGAAKIIFDDPGLGQVFVRAYSAASGVHPLEPRRFFPSSDYRKAFPTRRLFGHVGSEWEDLRAGYGLLSAIAVHAGLGATSRHRLSSNAISGPAFDPPVEVLRDWYVLLKLYFLMWKIFFGFFSMLADKQLGLQLEGANWWQNLCLTRSERLPSAVPV